MKLSISFEVLNLDDEWIAVPVGDNASELKGVMKLNEEAAAIVNLLAEDTTEDAIADELLKEYSIPREELLKEVRSFIEQLRGKNLITD